MGRSSGNKVTDQPESLWQTAAIPHCTMPEAINHLKTILAWPQLWFLWALHQGDLVPPCALNAMFCVLPVEASDGIEHACYELCMQLRRLSTPGAAGCVASCCIAGRCFAAAIGGRRRQRFQIRPKGQMLILGGTLLVDAAPKGG